MTCFLVFIFPFRLDRHFKLLLIIIVTTQMARFKVHGSRVQTGAMNHFALSMPSPLYWLRKNLALTVQG
jgi:hypothetical protein